MKKFKKFLIILLTVTAVFLAGVLLYYDAITYKVNVFFLEYDNSGNMKGYIYDWTEDAHIHKGVEREIVTLQYDDNKPIKNCSFGDDMEVTTREKLMHAYEDTISVAKIKKNKKIDSLVNKFPDPGQQQDIVELNRHGLISVINNNNEKKSGKENHEINILKDYNVLLSSVENESQQYIRIIDYHNGASKPTLTFIWKRSDKTGIDVIIDDSNNHNGLKIKKCKKINILQSEKNIYMEYE